MSTIILVTSYIAVCSTSKTKLVIKVTYNSNTDTCHKVRTNIRMYILAEGGSGESSIVVARNNYDLRQH
jgi:hypothetical protein